MMWRVRPGHPASTAWLARAAVAMSALALAVSLSGVTPADAVTAVKRALNADAVSGIKASRKPKAGRLLPLGGDAKFPLSVMPRNAIRGMRGPMGPQGAAGAPGTPGQSMVRLANGPGLYLPAAANAKYDVARLDNLPPGNWLLSWSATADWAGGGNTVWCDLQVAGTDMAAADATVGASAGAASSAAIASSGSTVQAAPFSVVLRCWQTSSLAAGAATPHIDSQHIVAIRADSLEVTGVDLVGGGD